MDQAVDLEYRTLFDQLSQGIMLRQGNKILLVNRRFAEMVGYSVDELEKFSPQNALALIYPEDREAVQAHYHDRLAGVPVPDGYEYRFVRRNGAIGWWSTAESIIEYKGEPTTLGIYADVTERKQGEALLQRAYLLVSSVLNVLPVGVCLTDETGHYQLMNDAYCAIYEYQREEMLGQHYTVIMPPDQIALANAHYARMLSGDMGIPIERTRQRKDGSILYIEAANAMIVQPDGRKLIITVVRDITERKQAEKRNLELIVEKQRADVLHRFIGTASHDLRTPLSTINTSLYLLRKTTDGEKGQEHLKKLEVQAALLERLLEDMLVMSELDQAIDLQLEAVDLNALLSSVIAGQVQAVPHQKYSIRFEGGPDIPPFRADKIHIGRACNNILANALHYTPDGGQITIRTYQRGHEVVIEVQDTGIGISTEDLPHIFDHFYQGDQVRGSIRSGLGLAIVKRIIEAHQGHLEVESDQGKGSTFRAILPTED